MLDLAMSIVSIVQCLAWLAAAFIVFVTIAPLRFKPRLPSRIRTQRHVNFERSLAFAGMAFLFVAGFADHRLVVGTTCIIAAGLSELLQVFAPTRHARWNDAMAKGIGAAVGFLCALALLALLSAAAV
jgi:VanZ family protein